MKKCENRHIADCSNPKFLTGTVNVVHLERTSGMFFTYTNFLTRQHSCNILKMPPYHSLNKKQFLNILLNLL